MKIQCLSTILLICMTNIIYSQDLVSHDFNDGNLSPFEVCTTKSPNYSRVVNNRLKTFWTEAGYRGNRSTRGAEACGDQFYTYKEGWYGMNLEIGSDYPRNKKAGIAQIFGFIPGFWSWEAQLQIDRGDLTIVHRPNGGTSQNTEEVVVANFPYEVEVPIVIHFILSNQRKGLFEIWVDGKMEYQKRNINFGFGDFDRNDVKIGDADGDRGGDSGGSLTVFKMGQYNFDSNNYDNNETRTVYYDDVSWYKGANGFDIVNPPSDKPVVIPVHIRKRNASNFAIDGGNGGENRQNLKLWSSDRENENQQWVEIERGNGFYSYQKVGTNFCIDGNGGGANQQNVYLWACDESNENQHWKKENVTGTNSFKLIKRNAANFALNGGPGGARDQNIDLGSSSSTSQDLHWFINPVNTLSTDDIDNKLSGIGFYPNPVTATTTIKNAANAMLTIYDIKGSKIVTKSILDDNQTIDLSHLDKGIYYAKVNKEEFSTAIKLIK